MLTLDTDEFTEAEPVTRGPCLWGGTGGSSLILTPLQSPGLCLLSLPLCPAEDGVFLNEVRESRYHSMS